MTQTGNKHSLIVKNVTKTDFCKYSVKIGDKSEEASLSQQKPFIKPIEKAEGFIGGIAVFDCQVHPGIQVTWYFGSKKINRGNFRYRKN